MAGNPIVTEKRWIISDALEVIPVLVDGDGKAEIPEWIRTYSDNGSQPAVFSTEEYALRARQAIAKSLVDKFESLKEQMAPILKLRGKLNVDIHDLLDPSEKSALDMYIPLGKSLLEDLCAIARSGRVCLPHVSFRVDEVIAVKKEGWTDVVAVMRTDITLRFSGYEALLMAFLFLGGNLLNEQRQWLEFMWQAAGKTTPSQV